MSLEERSYETNSISLDLLKRLREVEEEIKVLKGFANDIKHRI